MNTIDTYRVPVSKQPTSLPETSNTLPARARTALTSCGGPSGLTGCPGLKRFGAESPRCWWWKHDHQ
jgi:hypothetical protein